jgi:hypothetical protein
VYVLLLSHIHCIYIVDSILPPYSAFFDLQASLEAPLEFHASVEFPSPGVDLQGVSFSQPADILPLETYASIPLSDLEQGGDDAFSLGHVDGSGHDVPTIDLSLPANRPQMPEGASKYSWYVIPLKILSRRAPGGVGCPTSVRGREVGRLDLGYPLF